TFTYYDALGRAVAVAKLAPTGNATATPQSLYKLDAYGNVVVRIDYGSGVLTNKTATVGTAVVEFAAPTVAAWRATASR
uniref:hypothetical protein n=1 Tax=Pseudomonas viridiflava TaxID=33069 RepID=UPI0013E06B10